MSELIKKIFIGCIFSTALMLVGTMSYATEEQAIGKVIALRGNVFAISKDDRKRKLSMKALIFLEDTIKTKNGRLQVMFQDNTLITLGPNSNLEITKYLWEPGNTSSKMETRVQEGSFRIMGGAITKIAPQNFKTDSPSGTIGIRGSMYAGRVDGLDVFVLFQGGKGIYVQNDAGKVEITQPGFGTRISSPSIPPEPPEKVAPEVLQEFETRMSEASEEASPDATASDDIAASEDPAVAEETADEPDQDAVQTEAASEDDSADQTADTAPAEDTGDAAAGDSTFSEPAQEDTSVATEDTSLEPTAQVSAVASDAATDATQDQMDTALTPSGTQQEILYLLLLQGFDETTLSTTRPSDGLWYYTGKMKNMENPSEPLQNMKFAVNWHNSRVIAFEADSGGYGQGFGFGQIDANGAITGLKILGSDTQNPVSALTGTQTFGNFYGSSQSGIGIAAEGYDYEILDQSQSHYWSDIMGAVLSDAEATAQTGSATWNGFFFGISEKMTDIYTSRKVFRNTSFTNFSLNINKDTGTFSGSMSGSDFNLSGYAINVTSIGGSTADSVYIDDKTIAAEINSADISPVAAGLKTYGNYFVSATAGMLSDYTTWGYWEVAYEESPSPGDDYHVHVPGAMWIAGVLNSIPTNFTGVYQGGAQGVMLTPSSQVTTLSGGSTTLNIDFTGVSTPVTGTIYFNETGNLSVTTSSSGDLTTNGFTATISGATTSSVNGAFFGPTIAGGSGSGPAATSGSFSAQMSGGTQYHGIFGGNLQP